VALEGGHVDEAGVDEGLDLARLFVTQRVRDHLERHQGRVGFLQHHERGGTHLFRLGLVQHHLEQDSVNLTHPRAKYVSK